MDKMALVKYAERPAGSTEVDVVVLDGLDRAMVGVTVAADGDEPRAVYDMDIAISCLAGELGIDAEEAIGMLESNFVSVSGMRGQPVFLSVCGRRSSEGDNIPVPPDNLGFSH